MHGRSIELFNLLDMLRFSFRYIMPLATAAAAYAVCFWQ